MTPTDAPPRGLLVSGDLFFASKITGTAQAVGVVIDVARDAATGIERLREGNRRCVLLDLTLPGLDLQAFLAHLPEEGRPRVIAFGPHVQTARLDAAGAAGCDEVLPRSRFSAELPELLRRLAEAP